MTPSFRVRRFPRRGSSRILRLFLVGLVCLSLFLFQKESTAVGNSQVFVHNVMGRGFPGPCGGCSLVASSDCGALLSAMANPGFMGCRRWAQELRRSW